MLEISWEPEGGQPQTIDFDAVVDEGYDNAAKATEHAVESGSAITDHVRAENPTVTLEAIVTNAPVVVPTYGMDGANGSVQAQSIQPNGQSASVNVLTFSQEFDRVRAIDTVLQELISAGQVLTVRTSMRTIEDCVLEHVRAKRSSEFSNAVSLTLTLRKIRIASSRTVQVPQPRQRRGQAGRNRGSQPGQEGSDQENSRRRTVAAAGFDFLSRR